MKKPFGIDLAKVFGGSKLPEGLKRGIDELLGEIEEIVVSVVPEVSGDSTSGLFTPPSKVARENRDAISHREIEVQSPSEPRVATIEVWRAVLTLRKEMGYLTGVEFSTATRQLDAALVGSVTELPSFFTQGRVAPPAIEPQLAVITQILAAQESVVYNAAKGALADLKGLLERAKSEPSQPEPTEVTVTVKLSGSEAVVNGYLRALESTLAKKESDAFVAAGYEVKVDGDPTAGGSIKYTREGRPAVESKVLGQ